MLTPRDTRRRWTRFVLGSRERRGLTGAVHRGSSERKVLVGGHEAPAEIEVRAPPLLLEEVPPHEQGGADPRRRTVEGLARALD